jgi:hypothetical protein
MTTWTRIDFGVNVKLHAVSAALREALLANMAARNHVPTATFDHSDWQIEKPITEWCLDLGGGVFTGEPFVDVTVDDLVVSCRAYQLEAVIKRCRKFEPTRMFATGQAYHKIHTWPAHSLVVTPCQYAAVIDGLTACIPEANARLTAFEAAQDARFEADSAHALLRLPPAIDRATFVAIRDQVRGLGPAPQPCCAICQLPQVETPSGRSCPNGHGGAPSLEVL